MTNYDPHRVTRKVFDRRMDAIHQTISREAERNLQRHSRLKERILQLEYAIGIREPPEED